MQKTKKPTPKELVVAMHDLLMVLEALQQCNRINWISDTQGVAELKECMRLVRTALRTGVVRPEDVGLTEGSWKLADFLSSASSMVINLRAREEK